MVGDGGVSGGKFAEPADQGCSLLGGEADLVGVAQQPGIVLQTGNQQVAIEGRAGKQVVEFMSQVTQLGGQSWRGKIWSVPNWDLLISRIVPKVTLAPHSGQL